MLSASLANKWRTFFNNELSMSKVSARWVPRLLTPDQKLTRLVMSETNLARFEADPDCFVERFFTQDECWVHPLNQRAKGNPYSGSTQLLLFQRRLRWCHPQEKWWHPYFRMQKALHAKSMQRKYYATLVRELRQAIKSKRPGKLTKGVLLYQDIAPDHKSLVAMSAMHDCGFELIDHPPYSPDLAPSDYFLFPFQTWKNILVENGTRVTMTSFPL